MCRPITGWEGPPATRARARKAVHNSWEGGSDPLRADQPVRSVKRKGGPAPSSNHGLAFPSHFAALQHSTFLPQAASQAPASRPAHQSLPINPAASSPPPPATEKKGPHRAIRAISVRPASSRRNTRHQKPLCPIPGGSGHSQQLN
jgi:hypothetical protein